MEKIQFRMQSDVAHIDMYGPVGDAWNGFSSDQFISVMADVKRAKPDMVTYHLNTEGGSVDEGVAIFHRMTAAKEWAKARTVVEGRAWSAGSLLLLPGDEREMLHGTRLMVHEGAMPRGGRADEMRKMAGVLDEINREAAQIYSENTNWTMAEAQSAMTAETWMDAEEAYRLGFTTVAPKGAVNPGTTLHVPSEVFAMFKNPPLELAMEQQELQRETDKRFAKLEAIKARKREENQEVLRQARTDRLKVTVGELAND